MINKQLNHATAELERLQRRRNGEMVSSADETSNFPEQINFLQNKANNLFIFNKQIHPL